MYTHCRFQQVICISITQILSFYSYLGPCRNVSSNGSTGLYIVVAPGAKAELIVKGIVTANSNGFAGMFSSQSQNSNLEINVESDATLTTCENGFDIYGSVGTSSALDFSGTGYTCDQSKVSFDGSGAGTVDEPNCQACL